MIEEAYAASVKSISDGPPKAQGVALGEQVAAALHGERATDGISVPDTYRPIQPGGLGADDASSKRAVARAKPWVLKSADQFRPGPLPQLSSALYARDYNAGISVTGRD